MKISVRKIVLGSLLVIVGLPLLLISAFIGTLAYDGWRMSKGDYPLADSSEAQIGGMTIRLDRYAVHPYLAEYKRVVAVTGRDGSSRMVELPLDTGGSDVILACATAAGGVNLTDRFGSYSVAADGIDLPISAGIPDPGDLNTLFKPAGSELPIRCERFLGRFDRNAERNYGFLPASEPI